VDAQRLINELSRPGASLAALYVITGDDPLLTIEATDALAWNRPWSWFSGAQCVF